MRHQHSGTGTARHAEKIISEKTGRTHRLFASRMNRRRASSERHTLKGRRLCVDLDFAGAPCYARYLFS